jgi:hypothetical protein
MALDHARAQGHGSIVELLRPVTPDPWEGAAVARLQELNSRLCSTVVSFIRRAESAGMRGVLQTGQIPQELGALIPEWYALVLTSVPLAGLSFESSRPERGWITGGWFRHITDLAQAHGKDTYPETALLKAGYFAFASSEDGDVWVIRSKQGFDAPVFLWDSSGMEPIQAFISFLSLLEEVRVEKVGS